MQTAAVISKFLISKLEHGIPGDEVFVTCDVVRL